MEKILSFSKIVYITTLKDIKTQSKYLPNFISGLVQLIIRVLFFLLFASVVAFDGNVFLDDKSLFVFLISSVLIWFFSNDALYGSLNAISNDLYNGTLEYIYYLPIKRYAYFLGAVLSRIIVNLVFFIPTLIFLAIYNSISLVSCINIIIVCALVCFSLINLGIWMASLGLIWKKVGSVIGIITLLFDFLAGAFLPVSEFPVILQYCSYILPQTWGYDLIRYYAIGESWITLQPLYIEYLSIFILSLFFFVMSVVSMRNAEKICIKKGFNII
jgi:ABC-2 type transport system permease protein